ncbi:hypothetical protein K0M31_013471, partial [Melipona bicolor]
EFTYECLSGFNRQINLIPRRRNFPPQFKRAIHLVLLRLNGDNALAKAKIQANIQATTSVDDDVLFESVEEPSRFTHDREIRIGEPSGGWPGSDAGLQ